MDRQAILDLAAQIEAHIDGAKAFASHPMCDEAVFDDFISAAGLEIGICNESGDWVILDDAEIELARAA